jgi:PAS domain S-box-containing protein
MTMKPLDEVSVTEPNLLRETQGEMAALIAAFDWSGTSLGPMNGWPQSLRTTVSIMLHSPAPMVLLWGSEGVMIYNDGYTVFANDRHPQQLGMRVLEGWAEVADFNANVMRVVMGGESLSYRDQELTLHRRGFPEQVWMNLDYGPVIDETGNSGGVLCVVVEITDRVLAERRIAQEGERLREMFKQAPGFMTLLQGPEHVFEIINDAYLQLVGHRHDIVGKPVREALPEIEGQGFIELLQDVFTTGEPFIGRNMPVMVQREPHSAKEKRYIDLIYQPITGSDGSVTGIFVEGLDVTDRMTAEAALTESQQRLNAVLENATVSIFLMDERQECIYLNAAAEELTGFSLDEVRGRALHDVVHHTRPDGSHYPLAECPIDRAFPENNQMQGEEVFIRKDGTFFPVSYTASPIRDEHSKTVGTIIEVQNIQERKDAEELQNLLLAEISHRVKNLFTVASGIIGLSARSATGVKELGDQLQARMMALSRANALILPGTSAARKEVGGIAFDEVLLAILLPYSAASEDGTGRASLSGPSIKLHRDVVTSFALVLHELATNSTKYGALAAEAGRLDVSWEDAQGHLRLRWLEMGGPQINHPPTQTGFGSNLIHRTVTGHLGGSISYDWRQSGLVVETEIPLDRINTGSKTPSSP